MLRASWLFRCAKPFEHYLQNAKELRCTDRNISLVARTLQAKDKQREKELTSMEKFLLPLPHRQCLEGVIWHFAKQKNLNLPVAYKDRNKTMLNVSKSVKHLRDYFKANKESTPTVLSGSEIIFSRLSHELHHLPHPLTIESARWTGLTKPQAAFMADVFNKLKKAGLIK